MRILENDSEDWSIDIQHRDLWETIRQEAEECIGDDWWPVERHRTVTGKMNEWNRGVMSWGLWMACTTPRTVHTTYATLFSSLLTWGKHSFFWAYHLPCPHNQNTTYYKPHYKPISYAKALWAHLISFKTQFLFGVILMDFFTLGPHLGSFFLQVQPFPWKPKFFDT